MVNDMLDTKMDAKCLIKPQRKIASLLVALMIALLPAHYVDAQTYMHTKPLRTGVVMARAVVLDNSGQPILVEYNADGTEGSVVSIPSDYKNRIRELQIISAAEYHREKERLTTFQDQYSTSIASGATLMSRQQFEQGTYPTADGKANIAPPKLPAYAKSVLVRGRSNRILNEPSELVLLHFSVDLTQNTFVPESGSVVLNPEGQVIASSNLNIAPRVGFFGDPNKKQLTHSMFRRRDDQVFGPVAGVTVQVNEVFPGGFDVTNSEGKYTFGFLLPPCPGFDFDWPVEVYANLNYTGFNPNGSATQPYTMRRQSWSMCMGIHDLMLPYGIVPYNEIEAKRAATIDIQTLDFQVDVMFVSGRLLIGNKDTGPIPVGNTTEYQVTAPDNSLITQTLYDFDNDGKPDTSTLGEMVEKTLEDGSKTKVFEAKEDGKLQAVYFSSRKETNPEQPDVIRLADTKKNFQANGLLTSISKDDFKKTDIMIFRESTGQLVLERRGMSDSDMNSRRDTDVAKDNAFYYRLMLRGPTDSTLNVGGGITRRGSWEEWSSQYKMTEPFQKRESDHLKSGEWIRVVAINRATGYMATQRTQLQDASQNEGGALNVPLQDMTLMPPNLKVWAERDYTQEYGLEQNSQQKNNIVGAEGAGLSSDDRITIYTEWFDEEGRALPEDLGKDNGEQYGLTGRLAKVATENVLTPVSGVTPKGSDLANFPIAPGRQTQVLRLSDNLTTPEHFYIHVSGTQKDESPNFGTSPEREGVLATRPKNVTPFLTPLYDENKDWKSFSAWSQMKRAYDAEVIDDEPIKPLPSYAWQYRPEYQFSQISLEVESILREYTDESGTKHEQELITEQQGEGKIPTIRSDDDLVSIFYSLVMPQIPRLTAIDGEQELVFSLGAQEVKAVVSENGQVKFDQLAHIDYLDPSDFLTIRMYLNHDAGNTLWEWAFTRNGLHVYFQVPGNGETRNSLPADDIEILSLLESSESFSGGESPSTKVPEPIVRTLGGTRLRYRYIQPSTPGLLVKKVTWTIHHDGRYCWQYGVDPASCQTYKAGKPFVQTPLQMPNLIDDWSVYWEPTDGSTNTSKTLWSNWAGTETDSEGVKANLHAEYVLVTKHPVDPTDTIEVPKEYKKDFTIKTRELKPETDKDKIMVGSDVQILEAMLWQLGISPQKGVGYEGASRAGISGWRINSHMLERDKHGKIILNEHTKFCDGSKADTRNTYVGGWSNCPKIRVSLEGMVRRFKGRNVAATASASTNAGASANGNVDDSTLAQLNRVWPQYMKTYSDYRGRPLILTSEVTDEWLDNALTIWDVGFTLPDQTILAEKTYTEEEHKKMLAAVGLSETAKTRRDLLRSWKTQEAGSHWGQGKLPTSYRMTEGGGDEYGSLSFNQILFKYRYSESPCTGHQNAGLNFYDPVQNIKAFTLHTATKGTNCPGPFNAAYVRKILGKNNPTDGATHYRHDSGAWKTMPVADDAYDIFSKAVAGYNAGTSFGSSASWSEWIKRTRRPKDGDGYENKLDGACFSCLYTLQVKNEKYGLPYRTYKWKGGQGFDVNNDGEIKDDSTASPPIVETTVDWCFAYGELEWMARKSWTDIKDAATGSAATKDKAAVLPVGRISCGG
jgi:hypothetical protein